MKLLHIGLLSFLMISCQKQKQDLQNRSIEYYFDQVSVLEINELIAQNVLVDANTISDKYLDKETEGFNQQGAVKYMEAKIKVYQSYFKDYMYLQHLEYNNHVYVLYFTMAGFDDVEWDVIKWNMKDWENEDKLSKERLSSDSSLVKLFWNYDEGPKNIESPRLFIENNFLVFQRGGFYHSLYNLKKDTLLINEESPWHAAEAKNKEDMNEWIRVNLHDEIDEKLKMN